MHVLLETPSQHDAYR
jgi:hypothetical protein